MMMTMTMFELSAARFQLSHVSKCLTSWQRTQVLLTRTLAYADLALATYMVFPPHLYKGPLPEHEHSLERGSIVPGPAGY